ncbi:DNA-binding transcriptional LysR family regulator [Aliiruegeria haliotis]|uniref:DNA-binding transcriptional LysR family regulator n=1 Tax=Aliiruegeria haliotis TaxID=1280846 RepID=A0A2T0RWG6_9RHOB|nr:LysR family transcriptional regulator [Aliiruegeria haliotis]PRY25524.1 DNA-binding transcriptional LysR family regulator [Aliiruegeria haliotis]
MPLRFTLRQLEYFVAVGEAGSISLASDKVNVSSPSISAAISQLEEEFGIPLFVRKHAHGLSLSQAGRQFMVQAKKVLEEANSLNHLAGDVMGKVQGPLSVGCLLTFAQLLVPRLRRSFQDRFPGVAVSQHELTQAQIFDWLRRAEIDIALSYDLEVPAELEFVPLAELPPYVLVGEDHPLAERSEVSIPELVDHQMILLDLPYSSGYFLSLFTELGVKARIAERTRDMAVMRSLVGNGFGYSIANIRAISERSPDGRVLRSIPLSGDVRPMKLGLLMTQGARSILNISAFVEHCREIVDVNSFPGLQAPKGRP